MKYYRFRESLRYLRVGLGFSRELLEAKSEINSRTIKEIEINECRGCTLEAIITLCIGMNLPQDFSFILLNKTLLNLE